MPTKGNYRLQVRLPENLASALQSRFSGPEKRGLPSDQSEWVHQQIELGLLADEARRKGLSFSFGFSQEHNQFHLQVGDFDATASPEKLPLLLKSATTFVGHIKLDASNIEL